MPKPAAVAAELLNLVRLYNSKHSISLHENVANQRLCNLPDSYYYSYFANATDSLGLLAARGSAQLLNLVRSRILSLYRYACGGADGTRHRRRLRERRGEPGQAATRLDAFSREAPALLGCR
eukprot:COSAG01_NODE_22403_length_857_cov_1.261214_1_plen_121_part_10